MFSLRRFQLPAFEDPEESAQLSLLKDAAARHGIRAKLRGDEIFQEGLNQAPRFLLNMEHYPKVGPEQWPVASAKCRVSCCSCWRARVSPWRPSWCRWGTPT